MLMKAKRVFILVTLLLITFIITSCNKNVVNTNTNQNITSQEQNNVTQNTTTMKDTSKEQENSIENTSSSSQDTKYEDIIKVIKTAINDLNWYNGGNSEFSGFEGKKFSIDVYVNDKDKIWVLFDNEAMSKYRAASFSTSQQGYINEPNSFFMESKDKKQEYIKTLENDGYKLLKSGEVTFGSLTQPEFSPLSDEKNNVFNEAEKFIANNLKGWGQSAGKYKIYLRNYRSNDIHTNVVIENDEGKSWIMDVNLEADGNISAGKFYEVKNDNLKYQAEQYKKVAVIVKEINVE